MEFEGGVRELVCSIYPELKSLAARLLRHERNEHTLQATALVHETFLRLLGRELRLDEGPEAFLALAAHQMREILVDSARKHRAKKRTGRLTRVPLPDSRNAAAIDEDDLLSLNEALERLGLFDARALRVVELKYFLGLTNRETAVVLGLAGPTIESSWTFARAWLYKELKTNRTCRAAKVSEMLESA